MVYHYTGDRVFGEATSLCLSCLFQYGLCIMPFGGEAIHLAFRSSSEEKGLSICSCIFDVSLGKGKFRIFLECHLVEVSLSS